MSGNTQSSATAASAKTDPLKRTTPRSSIRNFLEACHANKLAVAAQYLDLRKLSADRRSSDGPLLAEQLSELLNRNPRFEVSQLSDSPDGNTADGLTPNLDDLATFDENGERVTLQLERIDQPVGSIWVVAAPSAALIPELHAQLGDYGIEKYLPAPLINIQLVGTPLWIWIALVLVALILSIASKWLSRLAIALCRPITRRFTGAFQANRLEAITEPLRLLLSILVFRAIMAFVSPSALLRDYLLKLLALLFVLGAASLLMRLVDVASDTVISRLDSRERALTYSVFPLGIRFIKICIFCIALLIALQQWGYNTSTILAGVGVGSVAVALAAQKTIENLFGGVSLISDRPVLVGDVCKFGDYSGTVEDIGLRSTRIRTSDRSVVTIPNSQFSTMTLENLSKRDRMWFHPTIRLRRDTSPEQVQQMIDAITAIFKQHEKVDPTDVPVRFTKINDLSLDLDIFAYVLTPDYNEYLRVQTELLLKFLEAASKIGIGFAVPFQEEYNVSVDQSQTDLQHPYLAFRKKSPAASADGVNPSSEATPHRA